MLSFECVTYSRVLRQSSDDFESSDDFRLRLPCRNPAFLSRTLLIWSVICAKIRIFTIKALYSENFRKAMPLSCSPCEVAL